MGIFSWIKDRFILDEKLVFCLKCRKMGATVELETIPVQSPTGTVYRMVGKCVTCNGKTSTWVKKMEGVG